MQPTRLEILATSEAVALEDVKRHLIVEHEADDDLILSLMIAALGYAEHHCNKTILLRRMRAHSECWPADGYLCLPEGPVRLIESVSYIDSEQVRQVVAPEDWNSARRNDIDRIRLTGSTPSLSQSAMQLIEVEYIAGYGSIGQQANEYDADYPIVYGGNTGEFEDVPENIRQAIRLTVGHWYENRESVVLGTIASQVPMTAEHLLHQERSLGL